MWNLDAVCLWLGAEEASSLQPPWLMWFKQVSGRDPLGDSGKDRVAGSGCGLMELGELARGAGS